LNSNIKKLNNNSFYTQMTRKHLWMKKRTRWIVSEFMIKKESSHSNGRHIERNYLNENKFWHRWEMDKDNTWSVWNSSRLKYEVLSVFCSFLCVSLNVLVNFLLSYRIFCKNLKGLTRLSDKWGFHKIMIYIRGGQNLLLEWNLLLLYRKLR
jgi:hypothetical protein